MSSILILLFLLVSYTPSNTTSLSTTSTIVSLYFLSGKHVVFGRVIQGMEHVREVEDTPTGTQDRPVEAVVIADCGVYEGEVTEVKGEGQTGEGEFGQEKVEW